MRQRQFFFVAHLAEGAVFARRHEHRIVAKALLPARRPHDAPRAPRPRSSRSRHRARQAPARTRSARRNRARPWLGVRPRPFPWPARNLDPARPSGPKRCRDRRLKPRPPAPNRPPAPAGQTLAPPPGPSKGRCPTKVASVSSGSGSPKSPADTASTPRGASSAPISRTFPALWLATTRRPVS